MAAAATRVRPRVVAVVAVLVAISTGLLISMGGVEGVLSVDFYAASCPQLEGIVRAAVEAERRNNIQLTAGLLRIFFHDCLPQGCDASIFLDGENGVGPNLSVQKPALELIERIRGQVHNACGARSVSCADITALATRDAVRLAGGPAIAIFLGRMDSLKPATRDEIDFLPGPQLDAGELLDKFGKKGLGNPADLVALSGGHTVGKARCFLVRDNNKCNSGGTGKQSLDVITPDDFDNKYFVAVTQSKGVLLSDHNLMADQRTSRFVTAFATNQSAFFDQFAKSFVKLGNIKPAPGAGAEIRDNCFRTNKPPRLIVQDDAAAATTAADDEQGFAASA